MFTDLSLVLAGHSAYLSIHHETVNGEGQAASAACKLTRLIHTVVTKQDLYHPLLDFDCTQM